MEWVGRPRTTGFRSFNWRLDMISFRRNMCKMAGKAYVEDKLVTAAEFTAMVVDR